MAHRHLPVLLLLAACTNWTPVTTPAPSGPAATITGDVRVTDTTGRRHPGKRAVSLPEAIVITRQDGTSDSIPREAIRTFERGTTDDVKSFELFGVVLTALAFAGWYILSSIYPST